MAIAPNSVTWVVTATVVIRSWPGGRVDRHRAASTSTTGAPVPPAPRTSKVGPSPSATNGTRTVAPEQAQDPGQHESERQGRAQPGHGRTG